MKILNSIKDHANSILLIVVFLFFGWSVGYDLVRAFNPDVNKITSDVINALVGDVIDARMQPMKESLARIEDRLSNENDYSVILMAEEVNKFRTAKEVDDRVSFLIENNWNAQIAAMRYLSQNSDAREALKTMIIYEEVYKALLTKIMSY